jgi:hypothetical protein
LPLNANFVHCRSAARLPPQRTPQDVPRFTPLSHAASLHRITIAAFRSLCCGPFCVVPCCMHSTLLAQFALGLFIALQT